MNKKIMLIDDEKSLHTVLGELIRRNGYTFCGAYNGLSGLDLLQSVKPDVLLLDVMLPDIDGFEVCSRIRARGDKIPIIILSAKGDIVDRSVGIRAGADDYIAKPFDPSDLLLRIYSVARRYAMEMSDAGEEGEPLLRFGDLTICLDQRVVLVKGKPIDMTPKEFDILAFLAKRPKVVYSHEQIYEQVWREDSCNARNCVTVFVRKIREKIEGDPSHPKYLVTVRGIGYKIGSFDS